MCHVLERQLDEKFATTVRTRLRVVWFHRLVYRGYGRLVVSLQPVEGLAVRARQGHGDAVAGQ